MVLQPTSWRKIWTPADVAWLLPKQSAFSQKRTDGNIVPRETVLATMRSWDGVSRCVGYDMDLMPEEFVSKALVRGTATPDTCARVVNGIAVALAVHQGRQARKLQRALASPGLLAGHGPTNP